MSAYSTFPPTVKVKPTPFTVAISEEKLQQFKQLLKLSLIGVHTYENSQEDLRLGLTHKWLSEAKAQWENEFDWSVPTAKGVPLSSSHRQACTRRTHQLVPALYASSQGPA